MKRHGMEIVTDRTVEKNIDFEELMEEFNKASKERKRRKNKSKLKNHKR